jgi:hypothetical protein
VAKAWKIFEEDVAQLFGLSTTVSSGSKWFDQGDAVTRGRSHMFPLYADAKFTERASFTLKLKELLDYTDQALQLGKHFILPIRFQAKEANRPSDFVVLSLEDFRNLYRMAVTNPRYREMD